MSATPLDIALAYIARGIAPIPVPHRAKGPVIEDWQALRINEATADRYFNGAPMNVGVLTGPPSNGLTDVDLNSPEALALADDYLPSTKSRFGRRSKPQSHQLYQLVGEVSLRCEKYVDPEDQEVLLELRGDRHQTVFPGSTHVSGEPITWDMDGEPASGSEAGLKTACGRLAAAAMLLRCFPEKGRHDLLLALSGCLTRALGKDAALDFLEPLAVQLLADRARPRAARSEVERLVAGAAEKLKEDKPVPGWPKLIEEIGKKRTAKLAEWLGIKREPRQSSDGWRGRLILGDKAPRACEANVATALRGAEELVGRIRMNLLTAAPECMTLPWRTCQGWRPWIDEDDVSLSVWCQHERIMVKPTTAAAVVQLVASENPYHPVREYLSGLGWDGTPRLDSWLSTYLGAAFEDETYRRQVGRKCLIQAVARAYEPGCKADHALILQGPQGALKSSAVRILARDKDWFADEISDLGSKDSAQDLRGKWIIELAELSAMKRGDIERTKAFMSRSTDHYRPSYGRRSQDFPRQCAFFGTTNADAYLGDETGNRRFWPIKIGKIDIAALQRDVDQLWAEAVVAYRTHEKWWLDAEAEKIAAKVQAERRIVDVWEEAALEWADKQQTPFSVSALLSSALNVPVERQDQNAHNRVARLLRASGWERFNARDGTKRVWRYRRSFLGSPPPSGSSSPPSGSSFPPSGSSSTAPHGLNGTTTEHPIAVIPAAATGTKTPKTPSSGTTGTRKNPGISMPGSSGSSGSSSPAHTRNTEVPPTPAVLGVHGRITGTAGTTGTYHVVSNPDEARAAVADIAQRGVPVGLDLETTGLDPLTAEPRLLQLAPADGPVVIVDLAEAGGLDALRDVLPGVRGIAHNATFDMSFLYQAGVRLSAECTLLASHVLTGQCEKLSELAKRHLGIVLDKTEQVSDWSGELREEQLRYAAADAAAVLRLDGVLQAELTACGSTKAYELMRDAQPAIVVMQAAGMPFDAAAQAELMTKLEAERARLGPALMEALAGRNPNSGEQLAEWLGWLLGGKGSSAYAAWPKTGKGRLATGAEDLRRVAAALPNDKARVITELLLPFKVVEKQLSTYGVGLAKHIHPLTGRIHARFSLAGTVTGRMSSASPNMQNIPCDPAFRGLFRAPAGRVFVIADYSQMELRVAAILAGEERLLQAYREGRDTHALTAAMLLGKRAEEVTKRERQLAKAVNFGLLYGQGTKGLQAYAASNYGVEISLAEAGAYRGAWFDAYPAFRRWHRAIERDARRSLSVRTPAGRVRRWSSLDPKAKSGFKVTEAYNTPVQGGAAEAMLAALGHLTRRLDTAGLNATPLAVVHDEVIVEASEADAPEAARILEESMVAGMLDVFPDASTTGLVEAHIGKSWADK